MTNPLPLNRSLVVIDDQKLRRAAAAEAERLLAKIDRLERADRDFFEVDQGLYESWYALTFRDEIRQINDLREIATKLVRFHQWIVTLSQRRRLRPEEAYALLQEEELKYRLGSLEERAKIEEARRRRDAGEDERKQEKPRRERSDEERRDRSQARDTEDDAWWAKVKAIPEEELEAAARAFPEGMNLVIEAIVRARNGEHARLALLIWGAASVRVKKEAARVFEQAFGQVIGRFLDQMRAYLAAEDEPGEERRRHQPRPSAQTSPTVRDREEELKLVYRKFVRYLHPDKLPPGENVTAWQKKIWNEGQDAYQAKNLEALLRLYQMVVLRLRKLDELTMGEILASREWLVAELRKLEAATKEKRKAPFWKFSKRKDYYDLERTIRKDFERDLTRLRIEIRKLRDQHESLRLVREAAKQAPPRGGGKPKGRGRR